MRDARRSDGRSEGACDVADSRGVGQAGGAHKRSDLARDLTGLVDVAVGER